jgi:RHS repeat-associated protein
LRRTTSWGWSWLRERTPVYIGGFCEANYDASGALTGTTKYYQAFGRTIAMHSSSVAACVNAPCYLLADHLGSTVGITDASGTALSTQKYWPYGAARSGGITQTDKLYTGQQQEPGDAVLGLYNYKARFCSTVTARFVSADILTADGNNRFAYVRNNPARFNDPTGHGPTGGGSLGEGACPSTRPRCFEDGTGPVGGDGTPTCDYACELRGAAAYCHGVGAGDPACGGGGGGGGGLCRFPLQPRPARQLAPTRRAMVAAADATCVRSAACRAVRRQGNVSAKRRSTANSPVITHFPHQPPA